MPCLYQVTFTERRGGLAGPWTRHSFKLSSLPLSLGFWFRRLFFQAAEINCEPFVGVPGSLLIIVRKKMATGTFTHSS